MNAEEYIAGLVEQIKRDNWTLDHCPDAAPGRAFYEERIAAYQEEVKRLREGHGHDNETV